MDNITCLHREAVALGVIEWARDLCNVNVDEWEGCLRFVVEAARLMNGHDPRT